VGFFSRKKEAETKPQLDKEAERKDYKETN
jgi:hypothetical protein